TGRASSACASSVLSVRPPMISAASVAKPRSSASEAPARSNAVRAPMMASRTRGGQSWLVSMARLHRYHSAGFLRARGHTLMMGHSNWGNLQRRARAATRCRHAAAEPCDGHEIVQYEGYGPGGGVLMVECLTADPKRMGAEVRRTFLEHGGQLGAYGSVSYLFYTVGLLTYPPGTDEELLMQAALEAGAEDVV